MKKDIKDRFNPQILEQVCLPYGIKSDQVKELDAFESFIYEYQKEDQEYILRIGHSHRRTPQMIQAEVNFINFLADGGGAVSRAVYSENDNLVEQVQDAQGDYFLATAFEKAKGQIIWGTDQWNNEFFVTYGREIGKFHTLAKSYPEPPSEFKRYEWDDPKLIDMEAWLPESEKDVIDVYWDLVNKLNQLPKTKDTYGMTHQDAHGGNFFADENGKMTVFDFDDCAYTWYANDIGILFYYAFSTKTANEQFIKEFVEHFIQGYKETAEFDPKWLSLFPDFLKLRELELYGVIHRDFDVNNIEDDPWVERFMDGRKEKIINRVPTYDFDFTSVKID